MKTYNNCQKAMGNTGPDSHVSYNPFAELNERELVEESKNPCVTINQWTFQCPAQETGLLNKYSCQESVNT